MIRKILQFIYFFALGLLIVGCAATITLRAKGYRLLSVQTSSMAPVFSPGDAIMVKPVLPLKLVAGQVVSYRSPQSPGVIVSHRLIKVDALKSQLTTAGDVTHSPDPAFDYGALVGQVVAVLPGFGRVLDALKSRSGVIMAVILPALILMVYEILVLIDSIRGITYRLHNY